MNQTFRVAILLIVSFTVLVWFIVQQGINLSPRQQELMEWLLIIYSFACLYCIIAGEWSNNFSQVDRLWSTIPIVYVWVMCYFNDFDGRTLMAAILITLWGLRLSYNFSLKGGFSWLPWKGEEDYRWEVLRNEGIFKKRWFWSLFNVFFICIYQLGLILYFTLPVLLTTDPVNKSLTALDFIAAGAFVLFLGIETIADHQQYVFQTKKRSLAQKSASLPSPYRAGFIRSGLWSIVRHPNYLAEQMMWFCVYLIGVAASGQWINWTIGGIILLVLLFKGSSDFSERISSEKYPEYAQYKNEVGRFFPRINFFKK